MRVGCNLLFTIIGQWCFLINNHAFLSKKSFCFDPNSNGIGSSTKLTMITNCSCNGKGPLSLTRINLITAWTRNHMSRKVWDEIVYAHPNFNGCNGNGYVISSHILWWMWLPIPAKLKLLHVSKRGHKYRTCTDNTQLHNPIMRCFIDGYMLRQPKIH